MYDYREDLLNRFKELEKQILILQTAQKLLAAREALGAPPMTLDKAIEIVSELLNDEE